MGYCLYVISKFYPKKKYYCKKVKNLTLRSTAALNPKSDRLLNAENCTTFVPTEFAPSFHF